MPDAIIEQPTDVLVKITATNICGSDLHMYQGRTDMESGRILGHENMGRVVEIGKAVTQSWRYGLSSIQHWMRSLPQL
jgi:threonine dehydrogenase-like Zn-dependent dehydrogenase